MTEPSTSDSSTELANAKSRCLALRRRLIGSSTPSIRTLLRLVESELRFLSRPASSPLSSNLPHLDAVHHVIAHPSIRNVSRVAPTPSCHVDVVCTFGASPAWVLVSARNPARLTWAPFQARVADVVDAATLAAPAVGPEKVLVAFACGVCDVIASGLADEFGAVEIDFLGDMNLFEEIEDGWVSVRIGEIEELKKWRVFEITIVEELSYEVRSKVQSLRKKNVDVEEEEEGLDLERGFGSLVSKLRLDSEELINFDTTALIAIVSGISNGGVKRLMDLPEAETRARFKSNYDFVISQV